MRARIIGDKRLAYMNNGRMSEAAPYAELNLTDILTMGAKDSGDLYVFLKDGAYILIAQGLWYSVETSPLKEDK